MNLSDRVFFAWAFVGLGCCVGMFAALFFGPLLLMLGFLAGAVLCAFVLAS